MRAQTPSYVVSVKLQLSEQIENRLKKSFRISNSAYNEGISFGLKRFEAMKRNPYYQELLEARRLAKAGIDKLKKAKKKTKGLIQQVKLYDKALFELRKAYGLTESELQKYLAQQRRKDGSPYKQLATCEIQVIAKQVIKTLEKALFYQIKPHKVKFRSKYDLQVSYRNRVNDEATRLALSDKKGIAYRLYIHKKSTFVDYIEYFELDTTVDIKSISTNEWTCTIDESIVHIRINDDIYTLNQNMKFETPHGLVLYILKQKLEINTDDVY